MKTRKWFYISGLILIFQSFLFLPISENSGYVYFIVILVMCGFLIICVDALFTLFLAFQAKAKWIEFVVYLSGVLIVLFIGLLVFVHNINPRHRPFPPRPKDTAISKPN